MGGGDKARIRIGGETILERVLAGLRTQCTGIVINANGDLARFADTGLPIVADSVPDFAGHGVGIADWPAEPIDPFFNVNTPEDAVRAEELATQYPTV
jgi:molybdopterin-guanine dinucleotide biosynthesis protein A